MHIEPKASIAAMAAQDYSRERSHKRERSRSRDRNSKRSRRSPVPENVKESSRSHRSRSRERQRTKRDPSPDRSRPLDFAARQAARGRDHDRSHGNGRASSKDRHNDSRKADPEQLASLPGPPPAQDDTPAVPVRKAEPLSLEELLRKKQEEQAALAKVCLVSSHEQQCTQAHMQICAILQIALAAAAKVSVKEGAGGTGTEAQTRGG